MSILTGESHWIHSPNDHDLPLVEVVVADEPYKFNTRVERRQNRMTKAVNHRARR